MNKLDGANSGAVVMKQAGSFMGMPIIIDDSIPEDQILLVSVAQTPQGLQISAAALINIGEGPKTQEKPQKAAV